MALNTFKTKMKRSLFAIPLLYFCVPAHADNIYVDPWAELHTDETWSGEDGAAYMSNDQAFPGAGTGYGTVQAAVRAMTGGDDIYLRGGTYMPTQLTGSSDDGQVTIPLTKSGTPEDWSSIQSFPGEWAILNGNNLCGTRGSVIGYADTENFGDTYDLRYWRFERLEITGGRGDADHASAIWINGGPVIVRYCYLHDNTATECGENPSGLTAYHWRNSIIEYNVFRDNGCISEEYELHSTTSVQFFGDYQYNPQNWETSPQNIEYALRKNVMRYNLVDNTDNHYASMGVHNKGRQYLEHKTTPTWTYEAYGDRYHHNVFLNHLLGVACQQDFQQINNNIVVISPDTDNQLGISIMDIGFGGNIFGAVVYNNTIIRGRIHLNFGMGAYVVNPYFFAFNNLLDQSPSDYDGADGVICLGQPYMSTTFVYDSSRVDVEHNYIYRGNSTNVDVTRNSGDCYGQLTLDEFDSCYSKTNWSKDSSEGSDDLYSTGYLTRGEHTIAPSTTIQDGGTGRSHPYLSNITIPSYVGATHPHDNGWVAEVLAFDVASFMAKSNQGDAAYDEPWVEGATDNTAPVIVNATPSSIACQ